MATKSTYKISLMLAIASLLSCTKNEYDGESRYRSFAPDGIEFRVAQSKWDVDNRGNHRALISIENTRANAILVDFPWRRPDLRIESKKIIITDTTGNEVKDLIVTSMTQERGEIIFKPIGGESEYYIYYLPYKFRHNHDDARYGAPWNDYIPAVYSADSLWAQTVSKEKEKLPRATIKYVESSTRFNFWSPMGLIATKEEVEAVKAGSGKEMIIFPEDRAFPIQLTGNLPFRWNKVPESFFKGYALRNEYYVWQFGVWAAAKNLKNVRVVFSDLTNGKEVIPASEMTCFNQEGTNWDGKHVDFTIDVPEGKIQALWCGVQIPDKAKTGTYKGTATVSADGTEPQTIDLNIHVSSDRIADKGDGDLWRHSRLRWLNSLIGMDDEPTKPFKEMNLNDNCIEATGKFVTIGKNGMVETISVNGKEIFAKPQEFSICTSKGNIKFSADNLSIHKDAAGKISWTASSRQNGIAIELSAYMEFDGHLHYDINVSSEKEIEVDDVVLSSNYTDYASEYCMGCGLDGGYKPEKHLWKWDGPFDSYWIGGPLAGIHTEFRGGTYHGPLLNDYKPDPTPVWSNNGRGQVTIDRCNVTASTGKNTICKEAKNYQFNLLITPIRDIESKNHFLERYYHGNPANSDKAADEGCNIFNIHHAQALNPYINYPFIIRDSLINHIKNQHKNGRKVKLYYTIRELTTHCSEVYAFHSLNHEIFAAGVGYGLPWECEHLVDDYKPAWYTSLENLPDFEPDAALVLTGNSRFINYWLEGLRWMEENYGLDGIYMDDVSFDRTTVKRIRKILDRYHEGSLIDLHSNTAYSRGPANQYTEFFPYVDRLWFGESFRYDQMSADEWFVTFSGIPFGRMAEMLGPGNKYLGMVFGATSRYPYPTQIWKFWKEFGIENSTMVGWWDPKCPVTTSDNEVKATAFVKNDTILVSLGNFSERDKVVNLQIPSDKVKIEAPEIEGFQTAQSFEVGKPISVKAKEGYLLIVSGI